MNLDYAYAIAVELSWLRERAGLDNFELVKEIILPSDREYTQEEILYRLRAHNYPHIIADLLKCQCREHLTGGTLTTEPCPLCRAKTAIAVHAT